MLSSARARQLFKFHRWTGLLTGLFILFLSLTGAGLVFIHDIDRWIHPSLLVADPPGPTAERVAPEVALESVYEMYPDATATSVELPLLDNSVFTVNVRRIENLAEPSFDQVMVDPYTAGIAGTRNYQSTLAFVLRQLHLRFYAFGWQGRVVIGVFGLLLLLSTVTGLLIYTRFIRALPHWWSIRRNRGFQISTSDWHKLIGIAALAFNLVIAFTGAVLGLENLARFSPPVAEALHPGPPEAAPEPPTSLEQAISISDALRSAGEAIDGFIPRTVILPVEGRSHYVVRGDIAGKIAMAGATSAGVDALSGEVWYQLDARKARAVTRAYNWMDPLHFGYWGGVWSQILYLAFGLTTGFLSVTGFILWYMKTIRRKRRVALPSPATR